MGFTSLLLGDKNPVSKYVADNRHTIRGAFAGFGQGRNFSEGLGQAALGANQGASQDDVYAIQQAAEAKRQEQLMTTISEMRKYNPELADIVATGGLDVQTGWNQILQGMQEPKPIKASAGDVFLDPETYQPISSVPDPAASADAAKDAFGFEKDLFAQYSGADPVKTYSAVRDGYERVRASAQQQSGAGDMGLIYGYMRMLDPGSVVRESEFAMAAQAGDFGEQVQGLVSQILSGQRLPESQRQEFLANADALYAESAANLGDINSQFEQRAGGYNVDPTRFIRPPEQYPPLTKPLSGTTSTGIKFDFTPGN